ncbi:fungal-specific transcription factor domain-containing protein [Aspergillus cavernicola]|uniref:Fungal-specific transcription factor domain-containing protein n=1 Tax=Aspergillus cavernicola TaxID=176166 RepID=A0ABR4HNG5_9EURO
MDLLPDQPTPQGRSVKRRRVALACDACRTRKSRCDGHRPKCGMCEDLGYDCVYTPPVTATNVIVQKDYLSDLELRVKLLEDSLTTVKSDLSGLASQMNRRSPNDPMKEIQSTHRNEPFPDFAGTEDTVDAMGAVAFADEEDCGFFGASSNIAFLRHLSHAVAHNESTRRDITSPPVDHIIYDGGFVNATRPSSPSLGQTPGVPQGRQSDMFTLPSPEGTLTLIHRYFADTGLLFPYIHPPAFFETYSQLMNNSKRIRRTWLGLLNIILAMAKLTAVSGLSPAETCLSESAVYYRRAVNLCKGEILRGTTLEVVQYLLLMGQYLQGTQKSVQAWTIHGLAVKAALQLGLHSKDASTAFPPLEQEIRKRTWFGCVVLDRALSMTFGRPAAIPDCYVQLDLPAFQGNTEVLPVTANHDEVRHSIQFFNSTITLYKQMASIIDQIYGQNLGCGPPLPVGETVSRVLGIENQLFSWVLALPESLRQLTVQGMREEIEQSRDQPRLFPLKFRVILTLRYLHVQILLHRPILVKFLDSTRASGVESSEERLLNDIGYSSMKKCVESAMGIIDIIYELVSSSGWPRDLLGAWWFSLYYTFNAALVIIGATWVLRARQSAKDSANACVNIHIYPGRAVATLYKLNTGNRMVDRCRYYLEELISALRLQPEEIPDVSIANLGIPAMNTSTPNLNFPSLGIEGGEFMLDDLFTSFAHGSGFEHW